jgi:putative transposase
MPQYLSAVYIHLVFSTKHRRPLLRDAARRGALHGYLGSVSKNLDCPPILVVGVEDHVHLLCRFGRSIAQAEWVKELKRVSHLWLQEQGPDYADFQWRGGYANFSVSQSNLEEVKRYIAGQEEHRRKLGFQDELTRAASSTCGRMKSKCSWSPARSATSRIGSWCSRAD